MPFSSLSGGSFRGEPAAWLRNRGAGRQLRGAARLRRVEALPLLEGTWRTDDGPDVHERGFAARLTPGSLGVRADGSVRVLSTTGTSSGHVVIVALDERLGPIDSEKAG